MEESSQKLFRLPGTIEEEEEEEEERTEERAPKEVLESAVQTESPLLGRKVSTISALPRNVTLVRVSTQSSSIAGGVYRQDSTRSRYRAGPTRKLRRRAVLKNGDCNVLQSRISRRSLRFLQDIFTTLVDTQWRWTLMCFILSFFLSWLGFAVIWWLIAFTHGDFEERHLPPYQVENNWTPCVYNIFSFTSCFLFSIETQHTIGYGSRSTTEECPEAIFVMCIQSISGVMIQAFMVGIVFAKMTRPKQRTQTLLFSRNAVICQRDGELCLMFRVGDMRKSHIIGATVRAQVIRNRTTKEGEILSQNQQELTVGTDGQNGDLFFIWPTTIIHRIDDESPFYNMSAENMLTDRFEIVLILEGTIESTGQTTQARSSYLPQEILWGHRFDPMVCYSKERQGYEVDYSLFDSTTQVDTPLCSGKELAEFYKVQDELRHGAGILLDEDSLERQCCCQVTNQRRLRASLAPLDTPKSHDSAEDEQRWRNSGRAQPSSNYKSREPQLESVDPSKVFDFDPNAIQVMDDMEFEYLPEAVNREILKNSQEITFEDEEGMLRITPPRLYQERSRTTRSDRETLLEEEGNNASIRRPLERGVIKLSARNTSKNYWEEKLPLMKVEEHREDDKNILHRPDRRCKMKSKKDYKMYLERMLEMRDHRCRLTPVSRGQREPKTDFFSNEEQKSLRKLRRNRGNNTFMINDGRFFREPETDAIDQPSASFSRDQPKTNHFSGNQRENSSTELNEHLKNNSFAASDGRSLRKSKRKCLEERLQAHDPFLDKKQDTVDVEKAPEYPESIAINNMRYLKILEEGESSSRESLMLNQRSNYKFPEGGNGDHRVERFDKVRIESEKRKSAGRLAKVIIQRKFHSADLRSPLSDLSPESGFCEGNFLNLSPECGRRELRLVPRNRFEDADEVKGDSSSSENNLSQKNILNTGNREQCVQVPIAELSRRIRDNLEAVDASRTSSHGNLSRKHFVNEDDIPMRRSQSPVIGISSRANDSLDEKKISSGRNLSYRRFFNEDNSTVRCNKVPINSVDNYIHDIDHRISSNGDSRSKHLVADDDDDDHPEELAENPGARLIRNVQRFVEDEDVGKYADASAEGPKITRIDDEARDITEATNIRSLPVASRKLLNDFDDSSESSNCRLAIAKANSEL